MQKNHTCKILAIGIIVLFIGVGIHPAFAVDTKQSMVNKASKEDCGCKEVDNRHLGILEKQLDRLEVYSKLLLVLSRDIPEVKEKCEEILDIINRNRQSDHLISCAILELIYIPLEYIADSLAHLWAYLHSIFKDNPIIQDTLQQIFIIIFMASGLGPVMYVITILADMWNCDWYEYPRY